MRRRLRRWAGRHLVPRLAASVETLGVLRAYARLARFQQHHRVVRRFPEVYTPSAPPRVLAVVTHVADPTRPEEVSAARLRQTLDGLLESLGHTKLELVVSTLAGRHVTGSLPGYQRSCVIVREHEGIEPMLAGFAAQTVFAERADDADWFLYLEDDLVLGDGLLLEKLRYFSSGAPQDALLLPHRFEYWNGRKMRIDLMSRVGVDAVWNRLTVLAVDGWRFAEFDNPHSGCYFLSREQLRRWLDTGRRWLGAVSFSGPRESAATGALAEAFRLYKPHPDNAAFLEIRHLGTAYSERYAGPHGLR